MCIISSTDYGKGILQTLTPLRTGRTSATKHRRRTLVHFPSRLLVLQWILLFLVGDRLTGIYECFFCERFFLLHESFSPSRYLFSPWTYANSTLRICVSVFSFVTTLLLFFSFTPLKLVARTIFLFYTASTLAFHCYFYY